MTHLRDDLVAAKALISTPEKWTKGSYNRGEALCAMGACITIRGWGAADELRTALAAQVPPTSPFYNLETPALFNDAASTTHADIMALFDRAINAAEA